MTFTMKYYSSKTSHEITHGVKILNSEFDKKRRSDWDLFIYNLGFIIADKVNGKLLEWMKYENDIKNLW